MRYHYVWLFWSIAFLLPWLALYGAHATERGVMWRASLATSLLGVTEPIFVPAYWNPPSLFELAQRTGFDVESFIFSFAVGGIGVVLFDTVARRALVPVGVTQRGERRHRLHRVAVVAPSVLFPLLYLPSWNPIYPAVVCLAVGGMASVICRPELTRKTLAGGAMFLGLYTVFLLGLRWFAPGYIARVWNLPALSGVLIGGLPLEELLFGLAFGFYWTAAYEHFMWRRSMAPPTPADSAQHRSTERSRSRSSHTSSS